MGYSGKSQKFTAVNQHISTLQTHLFNNEIFTNNVIRHLL